MQVQALNARNARLRPRFVHTKNTLPLLDGTYGYHFKFKTYASSSIDASLPFATFSQFINNK